MNWRGVAPEEPGRAPACLFVLRSCYADLPPLPYPYSSCASARSRLPGAVPPDDPQAYVKYGLVIHGDVGQTFLYGAKGGDIFALGSAAGRPLINAVGRPRVVINGTCLDYLAESFMAGDPLQGGGFIILNGITLGDTGSLKELDSPHPGGNLFSLASGGAIYPRDPHEKVLPGQLNGGVFTEVNGEDWALILEYLEDNERLFGIRVADLLTENGVRRSPQEVYRKVAVRTSAGTGRPELLEEILEGDWNR